MKFKFIQILVLVFFLTNQVFAQSWYNANWGYRKAITIDYTKVSTSDQTNFPVLVSLVTDANLAANARADGYDILFTAADGVTQLPYQRETYSAGSLTAWVRVPTLSNTTNTVIYIYYGYPASADQQQPTSAWDTWYSGVYHLNEAGAGTAGEYKDATTLANNGTVTDLSILRTAFSMNTNANSYLYNELTSPANYTVVAGDVLVYDIYWTSSSDLIAVDLTCSDGTTLRDNGAVDQNGLGAHPAIDLSAYALNKWYHRVIPLPAGLTGKAINYYDIACEWDGTGTKTAYFSNISIINGATTKITIYNPGGSISNTIHFRNPTTNTVSFSTIADPSGRSVSGKMFNALNADALRQVRMGARATNAQDNWTLEAWVNLNALSQLGFIVYNGNDGAGFGLGIGNGAGSFGSNLIGLYGNVAWVPSTFTFSTTGNWNHVVMKRTSGTTTFMVNGVNYTASAGGTSTPGSPNNTLTIGDELDGSNVGYRYFNGAVDEVRVSTTARSNGWLITEYNNQSLPSSFYTVGPETCRPATITPNITNVSCFGGNNGAISISVSGGIAPYSYNWSNGATSQNISSLIAGTYSVTVTATGGCQTIAGFSVSEPAIVKATISSTQDVSCNAGADGTIQVTASGGNGTAYEFSKDDGAHWTSGASNPYTFTGLSAGVAYRIKVKDSLGCESK